ncbi:glycosyl transferase group 1 [Siphonobacter sp. BAB-5385]|uniref:glycosyltransferase family 4 protein n=1 Tax=Siphonobacter sp. BAB-5385 TaxID=1864822 RepID=UPI000B9ED16B|nr:glycosyltransferase family 4 protein [Siphonobacter sp. BAB-5385]OZI09067.1 glycosyl transferase group 1 [Siphonobacter sp. BAB-5385]
MPTSVTLLSTSDNMGGASIGAVRLQQALSRYSPLYSQILVQEKNTQNPAIAALDDSWLGKKKALFRFAGERLYLKAYEASKKQHWAFDPAVLGVDVTEHPFVQKAQILHLHWINHGFLSTQSFQKLVETDKPLVWTMHDMWPFTGGCHHSGECDHFINKCGHCKFLRYPSEVDLSNQIWERKQKVMDPANLTTVACSDWLANRARKSSLLKKHTIVSIPNPLDTDVFKPTEKKAARWKLNLPQHKHLILFAAMRVDAPMKGFSYFKEALERLATAHPETKEQIELVIFGQTEGLPKLPYPAHHLGRLSNPERIALAYSAASVFVIPSLEENLPYTIMEAMACGTPSVGFNIGGIPELIDDGVNGALAEYRSSEDLMRALYQTLYQSDYESLRRNARQKVLTQYAEPVIARRYQTLYEDVLGRSRRKPLEGSNT